MSACYTILEFGSTFSEAFVLETTSMERRGKPAEQLFEEWVISLDTWQAGHTPPRPITPTELTLECTSSVGLIYSHIFRDPRIVDEENPSHIATHGESMQRGTSMREEGHHVVVAPCRWVREGRCRVGGKVLVHEVSRDAGVLQSGIEHGNVQVVGPVGDVNNLVILSAGYTAAQKGTFLSDVNDVVQLFKSPDAGYRNSVPFYRYFDVVNVFSVFQPSTQSGASKPVNNLVTDNNLECSYGSTQPRHLFCSIPKVLDLAETSPAKPKSLHVGHTIVVVLVNDAQYGGGGLFSSNAHIGCFYNGMDISDASQKTRYASLLFHELGHAWGDLFDEYDLSIDEPTEKILKNCASPLTQPIPWQAWIDKAALDTTIGVSAVPTAPCGYSNFLRPSTDCLMEGLNSLRMCPICSEAITKQMYATSFSLMWPICPLPDEIVHILAGGIVTLHVNRKLLAKGNFEIKWEVNGASVCPNQQCESYLDIAADTLPMGVTEVNVTITDNTNFVLARLPEMVQSRVYTIKKVPAINNSSRDLHEKKCYCQDESQFGCRGGPSFFESSPARESEPVYIAQCKDNGNCTIDYTTTALQVSDDQVADDQLDQYDKPILYALIGAGVAALLLWVKLCMRWRNKLKRKVNPIFEISFKKRYIVIRNIMMGTAVVTMLASLGTYSYAVYLYTQVDGAGKWLLIPGCVGALILYIVAFLGFKASYERSKCWLGVNGVVLLLCVGVCITIAYYARWFTDSVGDPDHKASRFLKDTWEDFVEDDSDKICTLQRLLECSGYDENCQRLFSTLQCPANCETTNAKYSISCRKTIEDKIEEYFPYFFTYSIVVGVMLLIGVCFNFILCYALRGMEKELKDRKQQKIQNNKNHSRASLSTKDPAGAVPGESGILLMSLNKTERQELAKQFNKFDRTGKGWVTEPEFKKFMKKAMQVEPTDDETRQLFRAAGATEPGQSIYFRDVLLALKPADEPDSDTDTQDPHSREAFLRSARRDDIRGYLNSVYKGDTLPENYKDGDDLPASERHSRYKLREMYTAGVRYGADPANTRTHEVDITGPVGLSYDYREGVGVVILGVSGASERADMQEGDIVKAINGEPIHTHEDLAAAVLNAKSNGLKTATFVTRQPFPEVLQEAPSASAPPAPRPKWVGEAAKLTTSFMSSSIGVKGDGLQKIGTNKNRENGAEQVNPKPPQFANPQFGGINGDFNPLRGDGAESPYGRHDQGGFSPSPSPYGRHDQSGLAPPPVNPHQGGVSQSLYGRHEQTHTPAVQPTQSLSPWGNVGSGVVGGGGGVVGGGWGEPDRLPTSHTPDPSPYGRQPTASPYLQSTVHPQPATPSFAVGRGTPYIDQSTYSPGFYSSAHDGYRTIT